MERLVGAVVWQWQWHLVTWDLWSNPYPRSDELMIILRSVVWGNVLTYQCLSPVVYQGSLWGRPASIESLSDPTTALGSQSDTYDTQSDTHNTHDSQSDTHDLQSYTHDTQCVRYAWYTWYAWWLTQYILDRGLCSPGSSTGCFFRDCYPPEKLKFRKPR